MKRRDFLKNTAITGSALSLYPYISKGTPGKRSYIQAEDDFLENDNIMILIDLFGGNDGLNTIIPLFQDEYYNLRENIAIQAQYAKRFQNTDLYMHPALVENVEDDGFMGMLSNGNLAIIERVGYPDYTMSHFRSSDIWASGILSTDPKVKLLDGWLGRYFASKLNNFPFEIPEHPLGISMGGEVPLELRSSKGHMGIALSDPERFFELGKGLTPIENKLPGDNYYEEEFNFIHVIAEQSEVYSNAINEAYDKGKNEVNYGNNNFVSKMGLIARLISGGLKTKVFHLRLSNFDSHVQQMSDPFSGQHPTLLSQLSNGISKFMKDATIQGFSNRVAGLTTSEFGRRAYDNGSRGSDHGAGNVMFMFAHDDNIDAGRKGDPPDLSDLDGFGNVRDQFDFRRLYADFLEIWFGGKESDTENVFGEQVLPMGILKPRNINYVEDHIFTNGRPGIEVYPNPVYKGQQAFIEFKLKTTDNVEARVFDSSGRMIKHIYNGLLLNGTHKFNIPDLRSGTYMVAISVKGKRFVSKLQVVK